MVKQIINRYQRQNLSWPKDWFIKFISVLFAVFLWYFVAGEDRVDMTVQIPVEIVNLPRNMVISNQFKNQLEVTVSGPRGMIRKISQTGISRSIDLSDASPGNIVLHNEPESINVPRGVNVLRVNPSQIILLIDKLVQKTVPIDPVVTGKLPDDFELDSIILEPDTLTLSGPQDTIKDTTILQTQPIDLSTVTSSTVKQVSLNLLPEVANLLGESIVTARIKIKDKLVGKKVRNVPVTVTGLTDNQKAKLSPSKITIKAQIPKSMTKEKRKLAELFEPFVDASPLNDGTHELKIIMKASSRITIDEISPDTVKIILTSQNPKPKK